MRHGKKHNHLGRKTAHRHAMLSNMASSLILHKRIETTVAKAKALRMYVEPLITKGKTDNTHNRRVVFSYLTDKESIKELFGIIAEKVAERPGGYTRIIRLPNRFGDNAEMCMMELVDFNETMLAASAEKPVRTRRSRRGGSGESKKEESGKVEVAPTAVVETVVAEEPSTEVVESTETPATEETTSEETTNETEKPTE
jgi:large subunit ribosomal protein L17